MRSALTCALAVCAALSCGRNETVGRRIDANAALGGEIAARVGDDAIPITLVATVASKQQVAPQEAARRLVDDAIAANAARAHGLDRGFPAGWLLVAARGRFVVERLFDEAKRRGAASDAEIEELSRLHWQEVDRPPALRVVHALAKRPKDPALLARTRDVAADVRAAVLDASSAESFEKNAQSVAHPKEIEIVVQTLPPITEDGRFTEGADGAIATFTKAVYGLATVGATSDLVETTHGWHVIRVLEKLPEQRMPIDARRIAFADEVVAKRAHEALSARLAALKAAHPVSISASADELMRSANIDER